METSRLLSRQKIQFFCLNLGSSFRFEKPLNVAECPCGQVSMWPSVCFHKACGRVSMWPSVHVVECPCGQVSMWPSDCVAKCLCGRMSVWPNVCMAERHVAEWHVAECHVAECLWAIKLTREINLPGNSETFLASLIMLARCFESCVVPWSWCNLIFSQLHSQTQYVLEFPLRNRAF